MQTSQNVPFPTNQPHPQQSHPNRQKSSSSSMSSKSSVENLIQSQLVARVMAEPDTQRRYRMCDYNIQNLEADIRDLDSSINTKLAEEEREDFCDTEEFRDMNKRKMSMIKEKKALESFKRQLNQEAALIKMRMEGPTKAQQGQQIHYPPPITLRPKKNDPPLKGASSSPPPGQDHVKTVVSSAGVGSKLVYPQEKQLPELMNNLVVQDKPSQSAKLSHAKVPVETSSGQAPVLPPRPAQTYQPGKNPLEVSFPPPKNPEPARKKTSKQWICEHCTFHNSVSNHACEMCDKTSDNPELVDLDDNDVEPLYTCQSDTIKGQSDDSYEDEENNKTEAEKADDKFIVLLGQLQAEKQREKMRQDQTGQQEDETEVMVLDPKRKERAKEAANRLARLQDEVMIEKKQAQAAFNQTNVQERPTTPADTSLTAMKRETSPSHGPAPAAGVQSNQARTPPPRLKTPSPSKSQHVPREESPPRHMRDTDSPRPADESGPMSGGSQPHSYQDILGRLTESEHIQNVRVQGGKFAQLIKQADKEGFDVDSVQIAVGVCESLDMLPLDWLRQNWNKNVAQVANRASRQGQDEDQNSVGELSIPEAETAYISCHGNVKEAANLCVEKRKGLFNQLSALGDFPREEILATMRQAEGNRQICENILQTSKVLPFVERVWAEKKELSLEDRFALPQNERLYHSISTSIINHQSFQRSLMDRNIDRDRRVRMILVEGKLQGWVRADMVIGFLEEPLPSEEVTVEDVVEAVRNCRDKHSAMAYLQQECAICFSNFPMNKIRSLVCQCKLCEQCLKMHFEISIKEKHVRHWTCPSCALPELSNIETASDYLQFLAMLLQPLVEQELLNLFETKTRDWSLQMEANFRWCAHCAEGFIAEANGQLRMTCPQCAKKTCFQCKKQWEDQHEGLTCEEYNQWKIDNDPTNQSVGLAKHLDENGIDCPNCKMRFALAKGGCMHFKCPQCAHEFCSGCNQPYHHKNACHKYKACKHLGFHCHCPRDCFSNLRDFEVERLQKLLQHFKKVYNEAVPGDQEDAAHCPVMEQKELDATKTDERCGRDSVEGYAGLCLSHYKEYLTGLINQHRLDPVIVMSKEEMIAFLKKSDLNPPAPKNNETPDAHKQRLAQLIKDKLALRR